ncbi:MAG TPA: hypothetical protein PLP33_25210 [Leptospiraceae bacterium]|nr:hypothetical protein [Leptospiraceae bacterium]
MKKYFIDELKAGSSVDGLIQSIMGLPVTYIATRDTEGSQTMVGSVGELSKVWEICDKHSYDRFKLSPRPYGNPKYSTDLAAAGKLLDYLRNTKKFCCLKLSSDYNYIYDFELWLAENDHSTGMPDIVGSDQCAPMAICKAALKWKFNTLLGKINYG